MITENEVPQLLVTIADLQVVQTGASLGVSEGRGEMSVIFALEVLVGLFFVPVVFVLIYRHGPARHKLDMSLEHVRAIEKLVLLWLAYYLFSYRLRQF